MLNGDAHHSFTWEFELRIWPLSVFKDWNARKDNRRLEAVQCPMSNVQSQDSMMTVEHIFTHCCPESAAIQTHAETFRLLYVGCDSAWSLALKHALGESEYRIVTCSDRTGAALFLRSEIAYQLLLIDLEWRGRGGLKLGRLARSLLHRKQMRIVVLADHAETPARKRGVDEWIMKSDMSETVEAIHRSLSFPPNKE